MNKKEDAGLPGTKVLSKAFSTTPKPVLAKPIIHYHLPNHSNVLLKIYNLLGQEIRTLVNEQQRAGNYTLHWDGKNDSGDAVKGGLYFYNLWMTLSFSEGKRFRGTQPQLKVKSKMIVLE